MFYATFNLYGTKTAINANNCVDLYVFDTKKGRDTYVSACQRREAIHGTIKTEAINYREYKRIVNRGYFDQMYRYRKVESETFKDKTEWLVWRFDNQRGKGFKERTFK